MSPCLLFGGRLDQCVYFLGDFTFWVICFLMLFMFGRAKRPYLQDVCFDYLV